MSVRSARGIGRWLVMVVLALPVAAVATPTDRIIIKVAESMRSAVLADGGPAPRAHARIAGLSAAAGRDVAWLRAMSGGADVLRLPQALPLDEVEALADALASLPGVEYAVPDHRVFPMIQPNDPRFGEQWNLQPVRTTGQPNYGIDAPAAWGITTGEAVTVAVVDTGILFDHLDLSGKTWAQDGYPYGVGYDFIGADADGSYFTANDGDGRDDDASDPGDGVKKEEADVRDYCPTLDSDVDSSWHGTHVAGIIAAASDNGLGVAGVSWGAMILPVRVLGKCGGYESDVVDGIRWAAGLPVAGVPTNPHPARIINLSLGGPGTCTTTWQQAIDDASNAGALVIAAAGNGGDSLNLRSWVPASCRNTMAVASTTRDGTRPEYSNYGRVVALSAPGGRNADDAILSTADGGKMDPALDSHIGAKAGTSMSAAHVAGVAALILSEDPTLHWKDVAYLLTTNVTPFPAGSNCDTQGGCGPGILNAGLAVAATTDFEGRPPEPTSSGGGGATSAYWLGLLVLLPGARAARRKRAVQRAPDSAP
jgi:serine protease